LIVEDVESMFQNSTRSIEVRIKPVYCVIRWVYLLTFMLTMK
jgi:hypothetical protein